MKINDIIAMIFGLTGLGLAFWEHEEFYGEIEFDKTGSGEWGTEEERTQYEERTLNTILRIIVGITSVLLVGFVYNHYRIQLLLNKAKQKLEYYDNLHSAGYLWIMLLEMLFCIIHVPPGFNWTFHAEQVIGTIEYPLATFIVIVMLGRIYLIWRILTNQSSWNSERSEAICNRCLCDGGVNFAIKAELKEKPYTIVIILMFLSIFVFGLALRTAERPFKSYSHQDWDYIWNGMWCIIITMTTVGFGDYYPMTHLGRIIDVLACFWGAFLVSLMVVSLTISSQFTQQERKAYDMIKQKDAEDELKVKASNAIKFAIIIRIFLRENPNATEKRKAYHMNKFKTAIIDFRNHRRNLRASEQDAPVDDILLKLKDKVTDGLEGIMKDCDVYSSLLERFENTEKNQKLIEAEIAALDAENGEIVNLLAPKSDTLADDISSISPPSIRPS